jgi:hypothetical protein
LFHSFIFDCLQYTSQQMSEIKTIKGDLFKSVNIIDGAAGIANTACCKPHGFTNDAKTKLGDWADPYGRRTPIVSKFGNVLNLCIEEQRYVPGSIVVQELKDDEKSKNASIKYCIWLVGQLDMSTPERYNRFKSEYKDTSENREKWFAEALEKAGEWCTEWSKHNENRRFRLGMANTTGCGLAGGNLEHYQTMMINFQTKFKSVVQLIWFSIKN